MKFISEKIREINSYICKNFLKISVVLFIVYVLATLITYFFVMSFPEEKMLEIVSKLKGIYNADNMMEKQGFELFWAIFVNNLRVSGMSIVSAITPFLFYPVWSVVSNGIVSGMVYAVSSYFDVGNMFSLYLKFVLPHAIFETPVFILANAMGLRFCWLVILKIFGKAKNERFKYHFDKFSEILILYIIPLLMLAAFIEGILEHLLFGA